MKEFTNTTVSFDTLPEFESVPFKPLNKHYLNVVYISNAIFSVLLATGLTLLILFNETVRENVILWVTLLVVLIVLLFWLSNISFRKKGYALREKDVLFRRGILSTTTTAIPFNRIQHVALHEGVFSRMYQLSELQVFTAGGSSSDLCVPGLPREEAERIKLFLLNQVEVLEESTVLTEETVVPVEMPETIQSSDTAEQETDTDTDTEIKN